MLHKVFEGLMILVTACIVIAFGLVASEFTRYVTLWMCIASMFSTLALMVAGIDKVIKSKLITKKELLSLLRF